MTTKTTTPTLDDVRNLFNRYQEIQRPTVSFLRFVMTETGCSLPIANRLTERFNVEQFPPVDRLAASERDNRLAAAVGRRLGTTVTFLRWEPPTRPGRPELPIFGVPSTFVDRAVELGFFPFQFERDFFCLVCGLDLSVDDLTSGRVMHLDCHR